MKNEERKVFRRELEENKSKRKLEELLELYGPKGSYDEAFDTAAPVGFVFAITLIGTIILSNQFNLDLSSNAFWGIIGVPTAISFLGSIYHSFKEENNRVEKRNMILERLEELDEEEKEKELNKVKTVVNNTMQKAKSNNETDIDKILNDMLFKLEKTNDSDNKEVSYNLEETKDKTLRKTRK